MNCYGHGPFNDDFFEEHKGHSNDGDFPKNTMIQQLRHLYGQPQGVTRAENGDLMTMANCHRL